VLPEQPVKATAAATGLAPLLGSEALAVAVELAQLVGMARQLSVEPEESGLFLL
jgi:hypothetical protein